MQDNALEVTRFEAIMFTMLYKYDDSLNVCCVFMLIQSDYLRNVQDQGS